MNKRILATLLALSLSGCFHIPPEDGPQFYSQGAGAPAGLTYPYYHPENLQHCWPPVYKVGSACTDLLPAGTEPVRSENDFNPWIAGMAGW